MRKIGTHCIGSLYEAASYWSTLLYVLIRPTPLRTHQWLSRYTKSSHTAIPILYLAASREETSASHWPQAIQLPLPRKFLALASLELTHAQQMEKSQIWSQ